MSDNVTKWLKAAPLPALILTIGIYVYAVDETATQADKAAAIALATKTEQAERLKRIEDKLDVLTEAVAQLNRDTAIRLAVLESKQKKENR